MPSHHYLPLPYHINSAIYYRSIQHMKWAVWLDSCHELSEHTTRQKAKNARFDILCADPSDYLRIQHNTACEHALKALYALHAKHQHHYTKNSVLDALPFVGGMITALSYEFGKRLHNLPPTKSTAQWPLYHAAHYAWTIVQDHLEQCSYFVFSSTLKQSAAHALYKHIASYAQAPLKHEHIHTANTLLAQHDFKHYQHNFSRIQDYLHAGDCYQVNYAKYYSGEFYGNALDHYLTLRSVAKASYSSFWQLDRESILCVSPEQFIGIDKLCVYTQPIKGTMPRSANSSEDKKLAKQLQCSPKDRAENLMIVDLLRNDLGKHCQPGSISVPRLFDIESLPNVHHLVSEVKGLLKNNCSHLDALLACFPGGSITGAPKHRAMQIIDELETVSRDLYCGSIAYFSHHDKSNSNICIRTFLIQSALIKAWAGGGIVVDSNADKEFAECGAKIDRLLKVFNTPSIST